jgi:hypothetical protein
VDFGVTRLYYHPTKAHCLVVQVHATWCELAAGPADGQGWHRRRPYLGRRRRLRQLAGAAEEDARSRHGIPFR